MIFAPNNVDCSSFDIIHNNTETHPDAVNYPTAVFGSFFTNTFKCLSCTEDQGDEKYRTYWYD